MKKLYFFLAAVLLSYPLAAQVILRPNDASTSYSILDKASIADTGKQSLTFQKIRDGQVRFKPLSGRLGKLGFTDREYWLKFDIANPAKTSVEYYLRTAEPVTDNADLYLSRGSGFDIQRSGDNLAFSDRSVPDRRTMFRLRLAPGETRSAYLHLRNDGEKNTLPLVVMTPRALFESSYRDQLQMGLFYGILIVIAITYLFFFFGLKEASFLHYSLYVIFMALCQFSLDGYYHQYIGTGHSWLDLHMVIISAILSCYFFGRYAVTALSLKTENRRLFKGYRVLFFLLTLNLAGVFIAPGFLPMAYPMINVLTVAGIFLLLSTVVVKVVRKQEIDGFFIAGMGVLFMCVFLAVLSNFGVFPDSFSTDDITKPGIALEVIALSLSMANRIRLLKTKKEELQEIALRKSEEMNQVKTHFLSNMSHELRTPLNAILGMASEMAQEISEEKIREKCGIIRDASYGLISSVNDILDFGQIEKGALALNLQPFSPSVILNRIAQTSERLAKAKGLQFEYENDITTGLELQGDANRLEQILNNVIGNASKFTQDGKIRLVVRHRIENGRAQVEIVVSDTGVGIAKQQLDAVFELFSQSTMDDKRKFGGFGIGLSIVKALVDLHQGQISLESEPGVGTTCIVQLSYDIVALGLPVSPNQKNAAPEGRHILIVEDNAMNQMVLKMMLKSRAEFTFAVAGNGQECLEMMAKENFDLILLDLQMPVMDGYEALSAIRGGALGPEHAEKPVIVITADATPESRERAFALGANEYMTKPVDKSTLFALIDKMGEWIRRAG